MLTVKIRIKSLFPRNTSHNSFTFLFLYFEGFYFGECSSTSPTVLLPQENHAYMYVHKQDLWGGRDTF